MSRQSSERQPAAESNITELTFIVETEPPPERKWLVIDPLIAFNESQAGERKAKDFALFVKTETGEIVAGLLGSTHWNHFYISAVFVQEPFRGRGIGRELLGRAEALALEQGCDAMYLDTFDFQARGFYERLGFGIFGVLKNYPPGHERYYMVKRITG